jgi:hypothetical protein
MNNTLRIDIASIWMTLPTNQIQGGHLPMGYATEKMDSIMTKED